MARPVNANASATRARILSAATRLFTERGKAGTSMRAIARRSKVSLATVHHYYGSKQSLYEACVAGMYDEVGKLREELSKTIAAGSMTPAELIDASVRTAYRFGCANQRAIRLTTRDAIETGELTPRRQRELLLPAIEDGVGLLARLTGLSELELRLSLRSVTYLVTRYAVTSAAELALVTGLDPSTPEHELQAAVEEHLVRLSLKLVGLDGVDP